LHLSKAAVKELERLGLLPKEEKSKKINPYAPYRSKWEAQYADQLDTERRCGTWEIVLYERMSFAIVPASEHQKGVWYRPDFVMIRQGGIMEIHEVKGHWKGGAKAKVKALAAALVEVPVFVVQKDESGAWTYERF
jgi:hypothetical protein